MKNIKNIFIATCALLLISIGFVSCDKNKNIDPTLTLNGATLQTLCLGDTYTELGASAVDADGNKVEVSITSNVDSSAIGNYVVEYTTTDANGNIASVQATVNIEFCLTSLYGEYSVSHDCTAMSQGLIKDTQTLKAGGGENQFIIENFNSVLNEVTGSIDLNAMTVTIPEETIGMSGVDVTISGTGTINNSGDVEITYSYSSSAQGFPVPGGSGTCTATYTKE